MSSSSPGRSGLSALVSLVLVLSTFLLAGMSLPASGAPDPGPGEGTIEGVVNDTSAEGLVGVTVDAFAVGADLDVDPAAGSTTTPSEEGRSEGYWALALAAGEYRLRFSGEGLQTQWYGGGAGQVVEVYEDGSSRLRPTTVRGAGQARVTGYLYDSVTGRYVNDLLVEAVNDSEVGASALTYESSTDWQDGFFALHLPAGTWQLRVSDPDGRGYVDFVLDEIVVGEAEELDLGAHAVDRSVGQVSVSVSDRSGQPLEFIRVKVGELPGRPRFVRKAWTDAAGRVLLDGVPASTNDYTVCAGLGPARECLGGVTRVKDAEPVVVEAGETTTVDLVLDQVVVSGSVVDENGDPYGLVDVKVFTVDEGSAARAAWARADDGGRYDAATPRRGINYTVCAANRDRTSCLGGANDPAEAETFTLDPDTTAYEIAEPLVLARPCQGRVVTNGTVSLGVNCLGQLNLDNPYVGLTYNPTQNDSTVAGCPCEGWGVADADSHVSGYANNSSGISGNLELLDFSVEEDAEGQAVAATSTVQVDETFVITHDYRPSPATENAYEVNVSVENISDVTADLRYRRVMDWDIEPTEFSEYVTMQTGDAEELVFASNDGFASADPLRGPSDIGHVGDFIDAGPDDHGALFDFAFGSLRAGETKTFHTFYGGAGNETDALSALAAINAEAYSLGQPSTPDGPTLGTPNTFLFAFSGVGGSAVVPPVANDDRFAVAMDDPGARLLVLENDTHPESRTLRVASHTLAGHGDVVCSSTDCTYTPETGYVGSDSFEYTITDGRGGFASATVTIDVSDDSAAENTELPTIVGTPAVGSELTAEPGEWTSSGGELSFAYRWLRDGEPISGAGGESYTPAAADLGHDISVRVTASRPGAAPASATSTGVVVGEGPAPTSTSRPTIPAAEFDRVMTATPGAWTPAPERFTYQWRLDGVDVPGATADSFRPGADQVGKQLSVVVTARTLGYAPASAESAPRVVAAGPPAVNSMRPSISGVAAAGRTLHAAPGTWSGSGLSFEYQWLVDGAPVDGATDNTWVVDAAEGALVSVRVTAGRDGHADGVAESLPLEMGAAATEVVSAPRIEGTTTIRETLTLVPAVFADDDVTVSTAWYASYPHWDEHRFLLQSGGERLVLPDWATGLHISVEQVASRSGTAPVASLSPLAGPVAGIPSLYGDDRSLVGTGRAGSPLTLTGGEWRSSADGRPRVEGVTETITWYIGSRVVGTGTSYTPTAADGGRYLQAYVRGAKSGYLDGTRWTDAKRVAYADERDAVLKVEVKRQRSPFTAVNGAPVRACSSTDCVYGTAAEGAVDLVVPARSSGTEYRLTVYPPSGSNLFTWSGTATAVADGEQRVLVRMDAPEPIPDGTSLSDTGSSTTLPGGGSYPSVYYSDHQVLTVTGCEGLSDARWTVTFVSGVTPMTGTLTEDPTRPGVYTGTIPGFTSTGLSTISTNVPPAGDCGADPISFTVYIDPSGIVTDQYGRAIPGATATLLKADAAGVFAPVPDGSTVMSPANRNNPSFTDEIGFFRWDVENGSYQVRVSSATSGGAACATTTTPAMDVPPERLDLLVKVLCDGATAPVPTTEPVLSGTPTVGQTLSATTGAWGSLIEHTRTEWLRDGVVVGTGTSYTLVAADQGKQVVARVMAQRAPYTQENGLGAVVTFDPTHVDLTSAPVAPAPGGGGGGGGTPPPAVAPVNTVAPSVTGAAKVGEVLAAEPGTWDSEGLIFGYQWLRDGQAVDGATASVYTATKDDLGKPVSVRVTASKAGRPDGTATSAPVTVGLGDAPTVVEAPVVSGEPAVGEQLSVSEGTWSAEGLTFAYQWTRDGTPIDGATGATYTVVGADEESVVGAVVTASKPGYADGTVVVEGLAVPGEEEPEPEEPQDSTTKVKVLDRPVRAGERAQLKVVVRTVGDVVPTGVVEVKVVGGRLITRTLDEADAGVRTLKLPKLAVGKHRVKVRFLGSEDVEASRAKLLKVRVKPAKAGARTEGPGRSVVDLW